MSRSGPPVNTGRASLTGQGSVRTRDAQPKGRAAVEGAREVGSMSGWESTALVEEEIEIDSEELREFLAADVLEVGADPVFKQRLREKLWRIVSERFAGPTGDCGWRHRTSMAST